MKPETVIIYPRGFVGFDTGLISNKQNINDIDSWVTSIKLNKPIMKELSPYKGIPQVDELVKEYQTGTSYITSFKFREKIITTALLVFGTFSFYEWCRLQEKNKYLTGIHKRFLNDTFNFISGKKRSIGINTWQSLLTIKETNVKDSEVQLNINDFFGMNLNVQCRRSFKLSDVIQQWCAKDDGFEDMLMTLHILFGSD